MKILEFTGAPGVGKSTLCLQLQNELNKNGYKVIRMQRYLPGDTLYQKIYRKYRYHMIWHAGINRDVVKAIRQLNFPMDRIHKEWIERILLINYQIYKTGKKYDYILLDEGMIQFITSLYHTKQMKSPDKIKLIFRALCPEYSQNTEIIYMTLDLNQVCERLRYRNRSGDRFVLKDEQQMVASLEQKLNNIDFTVNVSGITVFNLNCNQAQNTLLVQEIIEHCI